jgi:hypothetical protein
MEDLGLRGVALAVADDLGPRGVARALELHLAAVEPPPKRARGLLIR